MAAGPLRGYRTEDQTLPVLRGRLRLRDQELRRFGQLVPLEVTVDEWTTDTDENRRIRAAARRLLALPDLPGVARGRLLRLDRLLADVSVCPHPAPGSRPGPRPGSTPALQPLLHLADLVLAHGAVEHRVGRHRGTGLRAVMSWLFERLITRLIAETEASPPVRASASAAALDRDRPHHRARPCVHRAAR